jgi:hypothetical protein
MQRDLSPLQAHETLAADSAHSASARAGEPAHAAQAASGNPFPPDSIAFADAKLREVLHAADTWADEAIERRGHVECHQRDVAKLILVRHRVAELLLMLPPSAL